MPKRNEAIGQGDVEATTIGFANHYGAARLMKQAHRHNEIELNYVETGLITYLFGGTRVEIQAGQMALFWAVIPHQTIQVDAGTKFHWLTIPFPLFLQWQLPEIFVHEIICGKFVPGPVKEYDLRPEVFFQQWQRDLQRQNIEYNKIVQLEIEACLRRLAISLQNRSIPAETLLSSPIQRPALQKVEMMACFIAEHYTEQIHVEDVARSVFLHPNYAMSLFRQYFGMSIMNAIIQYRLAHAQRLLLTTDANVSAIAMEAGFGSVSRFYSAFKASCGQHPNDYRKKLSRS